MRDEVITAITGFLLGVVVSFVVTEIATVSICAGYWERQCVARDFGTYDKAGKFHFNDEPKAEANRP